MLANDVAEEAEEQHGVVALRQIVALGHTVDTVRGWLEDGRLDPSEHRGVYRVVGSPRSWEQDLMTLVLAAGRPAAASHRSAAALWGVPGFDPVPLEVVTSRPLRQRAAYECVHSSRVLPVSHVTVRRGIPVTTLERTLVDLAGILHPARVERAVDAVLAEGVTSVDRVEEVARELAKRGRRGIRVIGRVLDERSAGYVPPESALEARFIALLRAAGLPEPVRQLDVADEEGRAGRIDFAYPEQRLLIELDGRRYHEAKLAFEADRARDNRLVAAGWRVVRITWDQVARHPDDVVTLVRRLLGRSAA